MYVKKLLSRKLVIQSCHNLCILWHFELLPILKNSFVNTHNRILLFMKTKHLQHNSVRFPQHLHISIHISQLFHPYLVHTSKETCRFYFSTLSSSIFIPFFSTPFLVIHILLIFPRLYRIPPLCSQKATGAFSTLHDLRP